MDKKFKIINRGKGLKLIETNDSEIIESSDIKGSTIPNDSLVLGRFISDALNTLLTNKGDKGGYNGTLQDLSNSISAAITGITPINGVTPSSSIPASGNIFAIVTTAGTYTNWNNIVVPTNTLAVLSRIGGVYASSQTALDLSTYAKIESLTNKADLVVGKNKFDKNSSNIINGFYLNGSGNLASNALYIVSDYIPIIPLTSYYLTTNINATFEAYYDINKIYISSFNTNAFTTPANAAYVRLSIGTTDIGTAQLEIGTKSSAYEAYYKTLSINQLNIPNNYISIPKVNFITDGKNKFNKNSPNIIYGAYLNSSGTLNFSPAYNTSDYISVLPLTNYYSNISIGGAYLSYYDINKAHISSFNTNAFTTPANAAYVRLSLNASLMNTIQLELGSSATSYEQYQYIIKDPQGVPFSPFTITELQNILTINRERPATIAIAPNLYIPNGREISIYFETLHKYYDEYKGKTSISVTNGIENGKGIKLTPSVIGTSVATITVANEQFDTILTKTVNINSVNPSTVTPVVILNEGDSYTYGSAFVNKLLASSAAAGVSFVGIRNTHSSTPTIKGEGRGGYTLTSYMTVSKDTTRFSPFCQPTGNSYKFYGVTGYWKIVNTTGGYDWDSYPTEIKGLFNSSTGYLISPNINDVMYDNILALFKYWDGSAWITISEATLNFTFNFAKYRQTWSITQPNIFHSLMGTNDWGASSETQLLNNWSTWKTNMDTVINSIKADSPSCKIVIGIPNSSGRQGVDGTLIYEKRKRAYWLHASKIIETYGNREGELIYIIDYNISIDRQYAFPITEELPYSGFTGTQKNTYLTDAVHLSSDGFKQMGDLYMGLIQYLR